MSWLTIEQFIERLKHDEGLRQRLLEAESAAARDIDSGADAITQIAAQEGFDITGWPGRPIHLPAEAESALSTCCVLTCCLLSTSVAVVQEEDMDRYRR
jgi:hypothetical protein